MAKIRVQNRKLYQFSMNGIYLIIGGNLGNRVENLRRCVALIETRIGAVLNASGIYETAAWGKEDAGPYLNQVLFIKTDYSAEEILRRSLSIENTLGRTRHEKWESRLIDIDILFFNKEIIRLPLLTIPHPHLHNRKFVLIPLNDIAEDFIHPVFHQTVGELLKACPDPLEVHLFKNAGESS